MKNLISICCASLLLAVGHAAEQATEVKDLSITGGIQNGKARITIEGILAALTGGSQKSAFATVLHENVTVEPDKLSYKVILTVDIIAGNPAELPLTMSGAGDIQQVTGELLQDWSIRQETNGTRTLVLRPRKSDKAPAQLSFTVLASHELKEMPTQLQLLALAPPQPALFSGYVRISAVPALSIEVENPSALVPLDPEFLPQSMREGNASDPAPLAFRFQGSAYTLPVRIGLADPEARRVVLRDFSLRGELSAKTAAFILRATANIKDPNGGSLELLSGAVALTGLQQHPDWRVRFTEGKFVFAADRPGVFPLELRFNAKVQQSAEGAQGWNSVGFHVAPAAMQPLILEGLAEETQFEFPGAARSERAGDVFKTFLPSDGTVKLSWKASRPETEGKLFYAAEMLSQVSVSPGLMRQTALLDFKVMQGELSKLGVILRGTGEVTRVQGKDVLAWSVEPVAESADKGNDAGAPSSPGAARRLVVQFNQAQKDLFSLQVQLQTPLEAFPQSADVMELRPEGATRFAGYFRLVNDGAVRLEVVRATGVSQISPEKFPESDATRNALGPAGTQRFAYRFSGGDFELRIQADQIQPEVAVSELLAYRVAETELGIDAEIELDIREAPLRELLVRIPKGFAVARLNVNGLSDYFVREPEDQTDAELRLVFGQPVSGRQLVQLRLERNRALGEPAWTLPVVAVVKAKSVRGHVAVAADSGFRVIPERTEGLTEIATAFFPRKVTGIQAAFRLSDPTWQAILRVERLPQTVQVDGLHLFSIGEGIAYGSSVLNYSISGAPVSAFRLELLEEYFNVEFSGKDIRNWQKTEKGFVVHLHSPVSGAYTLLATYERPFKAQGETLAFTGARPLDTQSDQGHTVLISAYQFQVKPVELSAGLMPLETREVPAEYRLFFDAPILAAYRYNARPFNLRLALNPLSQGDSLSQVVDRASLATRISKEGQVLTDARYFVKNRGNPYLRLQLPDKASLWATTVNDVSVVPVLDKAEYLIPLPQTADANAVLKLDLKLASKSANPKKVRVAAPILGTPVMLAEWKIEPDAGQRLTYRSGSLTPAMGVQDSSGFAQLVRTLTGSRSEQAVLLFAGVLILLASPIILWRWASRSPVYKFSARHITGALLGVIALALGVILLIAFLDLAHAQRDPSRHNIVVLAPVQQAGSALSIEVANQSERTSLGSVVGYAWPLLLALALWLYSWMSDSQLTRTAASLCGWTILAWAALRIPNGIIFFFVVLALFLLVYALIPVWRQLWKVPTRPLPAPPAPAPASAASATAVLAICGLGWFCLSAPPDAAAATRSGKSSAAVSKARQSELSARPVAESVVQTMRVEDKFATATAKIRWHARKGQLLPLIFEPAVLTGISCPSNALKLVQGTVGSQRAQELLAQEDGNYEIDLQYEQRATSKDSERGLAVALQHGLVNQVDLTLLNLDADVVSPQAVSIIVDRAGSNTVAKVLLSPATGAWIGWKPRSRDLKNEKPVFYAEVSQLYVPAAGVVEGGHYVTIRPAQGEISELTLTIPVGATITDVNDLPKPAAPDASTKAPSRIVSLWRFDPDARKLRVSLSPPQSRPFSLLVRSQIPTGPLPVEQSVGLISVDQAAAQIGQLGAATGDEVQLDTMTATGFSPINLEDFPAELTAALQPQNPGLTVRRAYRYADLSATALLKASAVQADVRVETQDTVSLGEDRTVLAANPAFEITRAGIFKLSFTLPPGFDVESISGSALSHWTELKTDEGRLITLNLSGKTEGKQQFAISLAGPGVFATNMWVVPKIAFREASKHRGTLLVVPEQGIRLQVAGSEGLTQMDPQKSGIKQKGVLAFRILQTPQSLSLNIERVDAWVQVSTLQHVTLGEAQAKVAANLQYQIENTGVRNFRVLIPTNAASVRFHGEQLADFLPMANVVTNGLQLWEVKLHRRVIGNYLLQVSWQAALPENASEFRLRGVQALDVSMQRGFVTVQSGGRLQVRVEAPSAALQPAEWQSIPRALQQGLPTSAADLTYRLVEAQFELPLKLERHEVASLLPARVNGITFRSVISDAGIMLTHARLEIVPGDKRLLHFTLPAGASFWFAFVNQKGVWPWRDQDHILIPLEKQSRPDRAIPVEIFYTSKVGDASTTSLDLDLTAPKFDLPLENITWVVSLGKKWQVTSWSGSLQLQQEQQVPQLAAADIQNYLNTEAIQGRERTRQAEQFLAAANSALQQGDPQQARRDFQAAYGMSTHDAAFNEDARVQLQNIKLQQALIGLNVRQAAVAPEASASEAKLKEIRGRKDLNYTQQDAKEIIERNTEDDNAALMRLAERLIHQQDAAVPAPAALRANIPDQGRLLTFKRAVAVDAWANLQVSLEASAARTASGSVRLLILAVTFVILALVLRAGKFLARNS